MSRRHAVGRSSAKLIKDVLQLVGAGDDDAHADRTQVEQQAEVVQVAVEERILVVSFDLQRHLVLEAVDFVGRRVGADAIDLDGGLELLFHPAAGG